MEEEEALQPRGGPLRRRGNRRLDRRALQELLNINPQDVLLRLASDGGGLDDLVSKVDIDRDSLFLLLKLIDKSFTAQNLQSCHEQIRTIISKMLQNDFLNFSVLAFLMEDTPGHHEEEDIIVSATLTLVDFALIIFPTLAHPKVFMFPDRLREKLSGCSDASLTKKLERIDAVIQSLGSQRHTDRNQQGDRSRGMKFQADDDHAADGFRALQLIPTPEDLTADEEIFVRRNRESGRFDDLEDYLDVQFRLFRADFVIPLRESIEKYLGMHNAEASREAGRGVRVYRDVQIVRPVCTDKELAYRISFDVTCFPSVDWKSTQRLKYGSLVCLSNDSFQTYLCATVREHDAALLSNGLVDVVFILDRGELHRVIDIPRDQRFVMVESPAYFEAYRHVLQGLKQLNVHNFPFIRYIVECQNEINTPHYLQTDRKIKYDFRPLLDDKFIIKDEKDKAAAALADLGLGDSDIDAEEITRNIEAGSVEVLSGEDWPAPDDLKLDRTQYQALHNALTKEFAIVQGPPGTGKTYLGLKILKMLLHNSRAWNDPQQKRPLLIVCYTNHALDQFLEGVLDFFQGSLVRVGGQSKSDRLIEMNLTNYRKRAKSTREIPTEVHEARLRVRLELQKLKISIHEKAARLEIAEQEIVKEEFLEDFISAPTIKEFKRCFGKGREGSGMLKWLKLEYVHERLKYQAEHRQNTLPPFQDVARVLQGSQVLRVHSEFEDEFDDDNEDDETIDVFASVRDNTLSRKLDIDDDDDDFLFQDIDIDDIDLEREETESEKVRRRLREVEAENQLLRKGSIALDVTSFCTDVEAQDQTISKPSKAKDKEVTDNLRKLMLQHKRRLQAQLKSMDKMTVDEAEQVNTDA